jgi:hypothetical protein
VSHEQQLPGGSVIVLWVIHSRQAGYWLQVHTGTINESGPYYGFWSGFGSDIEEFGILGATGAGIAKGAARPSARPAGSPSGTGRCPSVP